MLEGRLAQEIAQRDNLTGLLNDRSLHLVVSRVVDECRDSGTDLSLLFLDLDYFKHVNDSHGHLVGSQVLREIGQLLRVRSEAANVIAARYGGDEFVLAAPGKSLEVAIDLAEQMREAIASMQSSLRFTKSTHLCSTIARLPIAFTRTSIIASWHCPSACNAWFAAISVPRA